MQFRLEVKLNDDVIHQTSNFTGVPYLDKIISSEEARSPHPSTPDSWDHWNLLCHWDIKKPHQVPWEASQSVVRQQKGEILWGLVGRSCTYPCVTLADGCWGEILLFSDQNKNTRTRLFAHELLWLSFLFFCILHDVMVDFLYQLLSWEKTCLIWGVLGCEAQWKLERKNSPWISTSSLIWNLNLLGFTRHLVSDGNFRSQN